MGTKIVPIPHDSTFHNGRLKPFISGTCIAIAFRKVLNLPFLCYQFWKVLTSRNRRRFLTVCWLTNRLKRREEMLMKASISVDIFFLVVFGLVTVTNVPSESRFRRERFGNGQKWPHTVTHWTLLNVQSLYEQFDRNILLILGIE